jgi:hypothetical protein
MLPNATRLGAQDVFDAVAVRQHHLFAEELREDFRADFTQSCEPWLRS